MLAAAPIHGRTLPGVLTLGAIGLVMGGAAAGLIWEAGSDWSGAASATSAS